MQKQWANPEKAVLRRTDGQVDRAGREYFEKLMLWNFLKTTKFL